MVMGYRRHYEDKQRLKKLHNETKGSFYAGAYFDDKKHRYVRFSPSKTPGFTKYLRWQANKRERRHGEIANHSQYKKL